MDVLIIIYPRIEQGIDDGHHDAEQQHSLIAEHLPQFDTPHISEVVEPTEYLMEYRHK
jgi:hypothetical protein